MGLLPPERIVEKRFVRLLPGTRYDISGCSSCFLPLFRASLSLSRSSVVMDERQTDGRTRTDAADERRSDGPSVGKSAERESDLR